MPVLSKLFKLFRQKSSLTEAAILVVKMYSYTLSCIEDMSICSYTCFTTRWRKVRLNRAVSFLILFTLCIFSHSMFV